MSDIISMIGGSTTGTIEAISGSMMYYDAMQELDEIRKDRPTYDVPSEVQQLVDLYKTEYQRSQGELSWEAAARARQQEQTAQGVAATREAATSASDLLGATTQLYSQERRALADLEIEASRQREQLRQTTAQQYGAALETSAQYQDKAWNWNEALKYQEDYNRMMGLAETGYQTWQMGAETIASSFDSASKIDWSQYSNDGGEQ